MRLLKLFIKVFILLLTVFLLVALALSTFVDPNDYKQSINELVQKHTGRTLEIKGNIQWSFTPQISLYLPEVSIGNAAGFAQSFFKAKEVHIKLSLLPLLRKYIVVDGFEVHGMLLTLERNTDGKLSIDDLIQRFSTDKVVEGSDHKINNSSLSSNNTKSKDSLSNLTIDYIAIKNSQILWFDAVSKQNWGVKDLEFVARDLTFESGGVVTPAKFNGQVLNLDDQELQFTVASTIKLDLSSSKIILDPLQVDFYGLELQSKITIIPNTESTLANGYITAKAVAPSKLLSRLGKAPKASELLSKLSGETAFKLDNSAKVLELINTAISYDKARLSGETQIFFMEEKPRFNFSWVGDHINIPELNDLIAKLQAPLNKKSDGTTDASVTDGATASTQKQQLLPVESLRNINFTGEAKFNHLQVMPNKVIEKIQLSANAKDGLINLDPVQAQLYGGKHEITAQLDVRGSVPKYHITHKAQAIDVYALLSGLQVTDVVTGTASLDADLATNGNTVDSITSNLNGYVNLQAQNGSVKGIDLQKLLSQLDELLANLSGKLSGDNKLDIGTLIAPNVQQLRIEQNKDAVTKFEQLVFQLPLQNGESKKVNLSLDAVSYNLKGNGAMSLPGQNVNIMLQALLKSSGQEHSKVMQDYIKNTPLLIKVYGPMSNLKIEPQLDHYLREALKRFQKTLLKKTAQKVLGNIIPSNLAPENIKDALGSIFGK